MEVTNRFRGSDLVNRVPEELWTEICNTVQEVMIKTTPKKKKCRKAKWLSEEALQTAEKRKEAKERQRRKGKRYPSECRVVKNSKEKDSSVISVKK